MRIKLRSAAALALLTGAIGGLRAADKDLIPQQLPQDQQANLLRFLEKHQKPERYVPPDAKVIGGPAGTPRPAGALPFAAGGITLVGAPGTAYRFRQFYGAGPIPTKFWQEFTVPWAPDERVERIKSMTGQELQQLGGFGASFSNGVFARTNGSPVSRETCAIAASANPCGAFKPVPTAVPPSASSCTGSTALRTAWSPISSCRAQPEISCPSESGTASCKCVRPIFATSANAIDFSCSVARNCASAGSSW